MRRALVGIMHIPWSLDQTIWKGIGVGGEAAVGAKWPVEPAE